MQKKYFNFFLASESRTPKSILKKSKDLNDNDTPSMGMLIWKSPQGIKILPNIVNVVIYAVANFTDFVVWTYLWV